MAIEMKKLKLTKPSYTSTGVNLTSTPKPPALSKAAIAASAATTSGQRYALAAKPFDKDLATKASTMSGKRYEAASKAPQPAPRYTPNIEIPAMMGTGPRTYPVGQEPGNLGEVIGKQIKKEFDTMKSATPYTPNEFIRDYMLASPLGKQYAKIRPDDAKKAAEGIYNFAEKHPFYYGFLENVKGETSPVMEEKLGQKVEPDNLMDNPAFNAGATIGQMLQFVANYSAFGKGIEQGLAMMMGKNVITKVGNTTVLSDAVDKAVFSGLERFGVELMKDIVIGVPLNTKIGLDMGYKGEDLTNFVNLNMALDLLLGGAVQGVPAIYRFGKLSFSRKYRFVHEMAPKMGFSEETTKRLLKESLIADDPLYTKGIKEKIMDGKTLTKFDTPEIIEARKVNMLRQSTHIIDTPERIKLRDDVYNELSAMGSWTSKKNGYKGNVKQEKNLYLIMGAPATGKSSISDPLSKKVKARIIDADMAKEKLPESQGGSSNTVVHEESSDIVQRVFHDALVRGDNIVYPIVGRNVPGVKSKLDAAKDIGYNVHLIYMDLPIEKAAERAVMRFNNSNKLVDPYYILEGVGERPGLVYEELKKIGGFDTYEKYSNDVPFGSEPKLIESIKARVDNAGQSSEAGRVRRGQHAQDASTSERGAKPEEPKSAEPSTAKPGKQAKSTEESAGKSVGAKQSTKQSTKSTTAGDEKSKNPKVSQFRKNTLNKTDIIPDDIKQNVLKPSRFEFIPEDNAEWNEKALKNVQEDFDGVMARLRSAETLSGGVQTHEGAIVLKVLADRAEETQNPKDFELLAEMSEIIAAKTREQARSLSAIKQAYEKGSLEGAMLDMNRQVDNYIRRLRETDPKKVADMEAEIEKVKKAVKAKPKQTPEIIARRKAELEKRGVKVVEVHGLEYGANGKYENGTIYINLDSDTPYMDTFIHELTHHIEASGYYKRLETHINDFVESLVVPNGGSIKNIKAAIRADRAAQGVKLSDKAVDQEFVSMFVEQYMFKNEDSIRYILGADRKLFDSIHDFIRRVLDRFKGRNLSTEERKVYDFYKDAEFLYRKAFNDVHGTKETKYSLKDITDKNGNVEIQHWSKVKGLEVLDPKYYGTGEPGADYRTHLQYPELYYPKISFTTKESFHVEKHRFSRKWMSRYKTTVKARDLYDMEKKGSATDKHIKELGYKGYYAMGQVRLYDRTEVKPFTYPTEDILRSVFKNTLEKGGDSVRVNNYRPTIGYIVSANHALEKQIPVEEFKIKDIKEWLRNPEVMMALQDHRNFIGSWVEKGRVYLDVSRQYPETFNTLLKAYKMGELAVFDMRNFHTIRTKWVKSFKMMNKFTHIAKKEYFRRLENIAPDVKPVYHNIKDSDGRQLSIKQRQFFRDSAVRNDDGDLIALYHGTATDYPPPQYIGVAGKDDMPKYSDRLYGRDTSFTVFNPNSHFGSRKQATEVSKRAKSTAWNNRIYPVYLNLKKPIRMVDHGENSWEKQVKLAKLKGADGIVYLNRYEGVVERATGETPDFRSEYHYAILSYMRKHPGEITTYVDPDKDRKWLMKMSDEDFLKVFDANDSYIAFRPEQIKSIHNLHPGPSRDIRYSLGQANYAPPFFSKLDEALERFDGEKKPKAEWTSLLRNFGVKQNELKDSGLADVLSDAGDVSVEELKRVSAMNRLQINVVQKGYEAANKINSNQYVLTETDKANVNEIVKTWSETAKILNERLDTYGESVLGIKNASAMIHQSKNKIDPQKANEFIEKLREKVNSDFNEQNPSYTGMEARSARKVINQLEEAYHGIDDAEYNVIKSSKAKLLENAETKYNGYGMGNYGANYKEFLFDLPEGGTHQFDSPHWESDANMFHARTLDVYLDGNGAFIKGTNGKERSLFILEMQSDWAQRSARFKPGKEFTFRHSDDKVYLPANWSTKHIKDGDNPYWIVEDSNGTAVGFGESEKDAVRMVAESFPSIFKQTKNPIPGHADDWFQYELKAMIRHAAENDYDRVSLPTERMVPYLEHWGHSYEEIMADPALRKKFGTVLSRYRVAIPEFLNKYLKRWKVQLEAKDIGQETFGLKAYTFKLTEAMKNDVLYKGQEEYSMGKTFEDYLSGASQRPVPTDPKAKRPRPKSLSDFDSSTTDKEIADYVKRKHGIPTISGDDIKFIKDKLAEAEAAEKDSYAQRRSLSEVANFIGNKIPASGVEKVKAVQRILMLLNPKSTISRNMLGNVLLNILEEVKNIPATAIDMLVSVATGQRTTTLSPGKYVETAKGAGEGFAEWGKDIYASIKNKTYINSSPTGGQVDIPHRTIIFNENHREGPLKGMLDNASKFGNVVHASVAYMLQLGDRPFYQAAYRQRIYELKKLKNLSVVTESMREDARQFALERTLQNDSWLAQKFSAFGNNPSDKFLYRFIATLLIPFRKTPANILDKFIDYSPLGYVKAVDQLAMLSKEVKLHGKVQTQVFNQKKFVDTLGRSLTGTGLCITGYLMAKNGFVTGSKNDSEKVEGLETALGKTNYAYRIGDTYHTFDWALPASGPIALGADYYFAAANAKDGQIAVLKGTESAVNLFFNSTLLQSVSRLTSGYSPAASIAQTLVGTTTQITPTAGNQIRQLSDQYARETYDPNQMTAVFNKLKNRIPGASKTLPAKQSIFGEDVKLYQGNNTPFNVLFNPGQSTTYKPGKVEAELVRLNESTGLTAHLPSVADKYIPSSKSHPKIVLSADEYHTFQKRMGQLTMEGYKKEMAKSRYQNLSDEKKVDKLSDVVKEARETAKEEILKARGY